MKAFYHALQKGAALALALILVLLPLAGLADVDSELDILLQWGEEETAYAYRVGFDGFQDCYWAQVPQEALDGLTLDISDASGQYTAFNPASGETIAVPDAGEGLDGTYTAIDVFAQDGSYAGQIYLYVSTFTSYPAEPEALPVETPEPTEPPVEPALVTLHYVDESGNPLADDTTVWVEEGSWPVYAQPDGLPDFYELQGRDFQNVTVDSFGASPDEVTFVYQYNRPAADPVKVVIHYVSEDGQTVASDTKQKVEEGTWPVSAAPKDLQDYYELVGDAFQDVTVDYDGAHPAEVTFVYR